MLYNSFAFCYLIDTLFSSLLPEGGVLTIVFSRPLLSFAPNSIASDHTRPLCLAPISSKTEVSLPPPLNCAAFIQFSTHVRTVI